MDGKIIVIAGCMFSGKSTELLRQVERWELGKRPFLVFKPKIDNRYSPEKVVSHNNHSRNAIVVSNSSEILPHINESILFVAIEEAQFFDPEISIIAEKLSRRRIRIVLAGLDMDSWGEPFGPMGALMAKASEVIKLTAICQKCGDDAEMTQRLIDGIPVTFSSDIVAVGGEELYEARCRVCHDVPGHPYL